MAGAVYSAAMAEVMTCSVMAEAISAEGVPSKVVSAVVPTATKEMVPTLMLMVTKDVVSAMAEETMAMMREAMVTEAEGER